jgi:hypothetical protein
MILLKQYGKDEKNQGFSALGILSIGIAYYTADRIVKEGGN